MLFILTVSEQQLAEEKKKANSLTDVMKKPTKVVLLKVTDYSVYRSRIATYIIYYSCDCMYIILCLSVKNSFLLSSSLACVQNMVGPGEVDEDLQPEVTEECTKYGEVANCLVYEVRV